MRRKILCLRSCPAPIFWQGMETLKKKYPDHHMDLLVQSASAREYQGPFRNITLINKPFFSLFSLAPNTWLNLVKERYDLVVLFYNSPSGAMYEPVKRMAFSILAKKIISVFPDGRMEEIPFREVMGGFHRLRNNGWLDGMVAGGMLFILYLACGVLGIARKNLRGNKDKEFSQRVKEQKRGKE